MGAGVLLTLYVTSSGAAGRLVYEAPSVRPLLHLYTPLFLAAQRNRAVKKGLDWYFESVWNCPRNLTLPPP